MERSSKSDIQKYIEVCNNGPYMVFGNIPLVQKMQIVSEYGEPLCWKKVKEIPADESYLLCRCGKSGDKPFCDGSHAGIQFDGTERAATNTIAERQETFSASTNIVIHMDASLCTSAGFCANRMTSIGEMAGHTDDTQVRGLAIAMIEHCPSGALTYTLEKGGADIEVDLPQQIAMTTEITSNGAIEGPLWVTGGITIIRADGQPFETRNRVTLCSCGRSQIKPLCDGSHRD